MQVQIIDYAVDARVNRGSLYVEGCCLALSDQLVDCGSGSLDSCCVLLPRFNRHEISEGNIAFLHSNGLAQGGFRTRDSSVYFMQGVLVTGQIHYKKQLPAM